MKLKDHLKINILLIMLIALITYLFVKVEPYFGLMIEFPYYLLPIIFGTTFSVILVNSSHQENIVPTAYVVCTFGVFLGTDMISLPLIFNNPSFRVGYLGGLGIFDFIYLSGVYSLGFSLLILGIKKLINK